jgi:hypothetical protein
MMAQFTLFQYLAQHFLSFILIVFVAVSVVVVVVVVIVCFGWWLVIILKCNVKRD